METFNSDRVVLLDQGSRPGPPIVSPRGESSRVLIIDHHMSDEVSEAFERPQLSHSGHWMP
jgi:nanoRNase/pAp phosphatase (c-di-AMP/oligoRNAs hydrolase)